MGKATTRISDHAVIRYLERHYNFDFEGVRAKLNTEAVQMAGNMGARAVILPEGRLVIEDRTVVTFLPSRKRGRKGRG